MKILLKFKRPLVCGVLFITILGMNSCEKNEEDPSTDRTKFIATWYGNSNGSGGSLNFTMYIRTSNSSPDGVIIENFDGYGSGTFVPGSVSQNTLTLEQTILGSDTISGLMTYNSDNTLSLNFEVRDGQTLDHRTGSAHK